MAEPHRFDEEEAAAPAALADGVAVGNGIGRGRRGRLQKAAIMLMGEVEPPAPDETAAKSDAAMVLGARGGQARAQRLTAEERSSSARKAASARWEKR